MGSIAASTKMGLLLVAGAVALFVLPAWLTDRCYYGPADFSLLIGIVVLFSVAFSPSILARIGAVDVFLYFTTPENEREAKFRGTVIRAYMRYVVLALCIVATSMLRQILVVMFMNKDFSYAALIFPFYLIVMRKHIFGGDMEMYLVNYLKVALSVCLAGYFALATMPMFRNLEQRCETRLMIEKAGAISAERELRESQSGR